MCEELPKHQGDCITGVFMENAFGFVAGRVPIENVTFLLKKDWLAPCNKLAKQYRQTCYSYHYRGYLPYVYSAHLNDLVDICLGSGDDVELCLFGLAEGFTVEANEIISQTSFPGFDGSSAERTAQLCNHFPEKYTPLCHTTALNRYIAVSGDKSERVMQYCSVATDHKFCNNLFQES